MKKKIAIFILISIVMLFFIKLYKYNNEKYFITIRDANISEYFDFTGVYLNSFKGKILQMQLNDNKNNKKVKYITLYSINNKTNMNFVTGTNSKYFNHIEKNKIIDLFVTNKITEFLLKVEFEDDTTEEIYLDINKINF